VRQAALLQHAEARILPSRLGNLALCEAQVEAREMRARATRIQNQFLRAGVGKLD
jgi:hypothetical protein